MRDRLNAILLIALVAQIPFELRYNLLGLTNLQWTFVAVVLVHLTELIRKKKILFTDRIIQAAAIFVAIQWLAAAYAPEFHINAAKGASRFTAGLVLLAIVRISSAHENILKAWALASPAAAAYALAAYWGWLPGSLFHQEEYYAGNILRLTGTFEYPNTAAAYFAMSLPIILWSVFRNAVKWPSAILVWSALILTLSRGGLAAVLVALTLCLYSEPTPETHQQLLVAAEFDSRTACTKRRSAFPELDA